MAKPFFVLFALVATVSAGLLKTKSSTINAKDLAGPVSDFANNQLPLPEEVTQFQKSAMIPLWLSATQSEASNVIWTGSLLCDSEDGWEFSFLSPNASSVTLTLTDPNGNNVDLSAGIAGVYAIGGTNIPETSWVFTSPIKGAYTLAVNAIGSFVPAVSQDIPFGYVITFSLSDLVMVGHLATYNMQQGQQVGLVATLVKEEEGLRSLTPAQLRAKAVQSVVFTAVMSVTTPAGVEEDIEMHDDGLHMDFEANDGVYGGVITAAATGDYQAQATLTGKHSDGTEFIRTTQHIIETVIDDLNLAGSAAGVMTDDTHMTISLAINVAAAIPETQNFRGYAEVYGQDANGVSTAACWIGGMTQVVQDTNGNNILNLILDTQWLKLAGVSVPLTLQNVIIQEVEAFVPVSQFSSIAVTLASEDVTIVKKSLASMATITEATKEMKQGVMPASLLAKKAGSVDGALILVHGYCAGTNPFEPNAADFTDAYYFLNADASETHDDFAQLVIAYAEQNNLNTYSIIGHSQGGIVGSHIKNFYFSGLDTVGSGKALQSIGTPYEGCTAAGSSASLGAAFGIGCGSNFDLSLDGARLWEPTITDDTRIEISYYTTTYKQGNLFGDSCNAAMNMVLEWPNDGTSEIEYTNIRGAINMGNTQKQCHTTDMNYMAQYNDHSRNQAMNAAAAR